MHTFNSTLTQKKEYLTKITIKMFYLIIDYIHWMCPHECIVLFY